jgi:hypothetical protein
MMVEGTIRVTKIYCIVFGVQTSDALAIKSNNNFGEQVKKSPALSRAFTS